MGCVSESRSLTALAEARAQAAHEPAIAAAVLAPTGPAGLRDRPCLKDWWQAG